MRKALLATIFVIVSASMPAAMAVTVSVDGGSHTSVGNVTINTSFGMVTGNVNFRLGNLSWTPEEIWLLPEEIDPEIFSKGVNQDSVIEIPNVTFSTCRTAVYKNKTSGTGFKVYNTGTTKQIFENGTFCGLAYPGSYFVYARY